MSEVPSNMMPLGTQAPDFSLTDTVTGQELSLSDIKSNIATVVMFICNHCPYVKHVQSELTKLASDYQTKGIAFVAISSNDAVNYPGDGPERMKETAISNDYPFPYLYDEPQEVAKAYQAACTPDFFVFDHQMQCVYRGQLDDSSPGNDVPVSGKDMRLALDNILNGEKVSADQKPSVGCNIKWKE